MLRRKIYSELLKWKNEPFKEALVVKGARQVGKSFIIEQFIKENFERMMQDFKKTCEVEFAKGFRGERKTVEIKAAIRGGNMLPLVREHRNACKQIEEQNRGKSNGKDMSASKTASSLSKGK